MVEQSAVSSAIDPYEVLGVGRDADRTEIRRRFQELARKVIKALFRKGVACRWCLWSSVGLSSCTGLDYMYTLTIVVLNLIECHMCQPMYLFLL